MDFPTLLIRDATKKNGFYKRVFEHGHFNIKDAHEWGYIITSEDIGKQFDRKTWFAMFYVIQMHILEYFVIIDLIQVQIQKMILMVLCRKFLNNLISL